jgi:hypothetical protein
MANKIERDYDAPPPFWVTGDTMKYGKPRGEPWYKQEHPSEYEIKTPGLIKSLGAMVRAIINLFRPGGHNGMQQA